MKLAYCTNIWNHHQGPVATELAKLLGSANFKLLLHQPLDHKYSVNRIKMGWNLIPPDEPWIMGPPKTCEEVDYSEYVKFVAGADVMIYSDMVPYVTTELLRNRNKMGRINMMMGERVFKIPLPMWKYFSPRELLSRLVQHRYFECGNVHFLTMGNGCVDDLSYYHACRGRIWRWGYLTQASPEFCRKPIRGKVKIGWCGRMIDWKRVDLIIKAIGLLPDSVRNCIEVVLLGDGDQRSVLKKLVASQGLENVIGFRDPVSSVEANDFMRDLDIYIFPSNRQEGWGAALLEAMDKGCAVIANRMAGSTLEVVSDGDNGLIFDDGNERQLSEHILFLVTHETERRRMGKQAWETIKQWSPEFGARRLIRLTEALLSGSFSDIPTIGICAKVG